MKIFYISSIIDAVIKSVPEPEAKQLHQSANQRTNHDMCSVKQTYLTNHDEVCHETNFHAFYTQQGVQNSWNHLQNYSDQEDMNFTNRRFSSPSICEHPSLEVVSSPTKKRSDPKQSMEFKMDLLSFQQAKNEEKSPRKYGVMVQFSKPVNPVLQLPNLESHRFNLSQTEKWRPGDVSKHLRSISNDPEGVEEFLPCTRAHMIRRILLFRNFPKLDVSPLWRISDQRPNHQNRSVLEAFLTFLRVLRCTSTHQSTRIQARSDLPDLELFLELLPINSQQLFSSQDYKDLGQVFSIQDVPKKLTCTLKPSRYKTRIKSLEENFWIQDIFQRLVLSVFLICLLLSLF
ncbi:hypothetical protein IGI04_034302 [Brassica rapa subsp. trilocularis]|uniref:Uncharacterized protein n=1 Tax=Brassica rapa subsp. trilocularis TaxID=1813537 RepID=A0ABQ7L8B0_BRACM|nr:hypothetical protein IGI04_034302 [Brassica rapa subsp. trilocularis]